MECLANTSSFDHACFKIDGFSFKKHSTKVGPRHSTPPQFLFKCAPLSQPAPVGKMLTQLRSRLHSGMLYGEIFCNCKFCN